MLTNVGHQLVHNIDDLILSSLYEQSQTLE